MNKIICSPNAPAALGPYSQAKLCGNVLYTSGQLGMDPATGNLPEGVEAQAEQALKNLGAILSEAGMSYADVVKTTVFLKDMGDFAEMNAVYQTYFQSDCPARSAVQVAKLPKDVMVEIEAIVAL